MRHMIIIFDDAAHNRRCHFGTLARIFDDHHHCNLRIVLGGKGDKPRLRLGIRTAGLRRAGFAERDIWDIAAIAAFFALSNRIANVSAMRPNDEFYMMGRLPK